jgi:hypothetical protein
MKVKEEGERALQREELKQKFQTIRKKVSYEMRLKRGRI